MIRPLLSLNDLRAALVAMNQETKFEGRENYLGASEIGGCPRLVAAKKVRDGLDVVDPDGAGRMESGSALENLVVQMIRRGPFGRFIRKTGNAQEELSHPSIPLRCHPDGEILSLDEFFAPTDELSVLLWDGAEAVIQLSELDGPGALEVKTMSSHAFRKAKRGGISEGYKDQVTTQLGLSGKRWGILVAVSRDNPADCLVFFVRFDAERWAGIQARGEMIWTSVEKIREGILSYPEGLPAGDPERSWGCDKCPIADECPAVAVLRSLAGDGKGTIPDSEVDDIEALADEFLALKPEADRFESVKETLKTRLSELNVSKAVLPSGRPVSISERQGRESADLKALKANYPDAANAVIKRGESFLVLSVKEAK